MRLVEEMFQISGQKQREYIRFHYAANTWIGGYSSYKSDLLGVKSVVGGA
jgi:hypothetical protein